METYSSWRELLGKIIHDAQEKQRIANELGVSPITLIRWTHKTSQPRPSNLYRLLEVIPQHHSELVALMAKEYPAFTQTLDTSLEKLKDATPEIPSTFYVRALSAYVDTPKAQRFWSISNLILQQALGQLDPNHVGLAIMLVQCMPPSANHKIRSLRIAVGRGTPPWSMNMEQRAMLLGAESLAGHVVTNGYPRVLQNREESQGLFPAHWTEWEMGAATYPILRAGQIAGCLLVSSTQPNYFLPLRRTLIQRYTELMTLVFEPEEFYDLQQINLCVMPHYRTQEKYLLGFQQRVSDTIVQSMRNRQPISLLQAQQLVWKQLEEELLQLPPYIQE